MTYVHARMTRKTLDRLNKLKIVPRESYNDVVNRLLDAYVRSISAKKERSDKYDREQGKDQ